ncbi:hypothetical protein TNIN_291711 [Trichonephila inaurata madagascariensis]|uniref:Uncharacterized protein n=1 Tax=Trichonephila inaurata madagascariensis TaxID=2747483 RepID=A0A8X6X210_9ARAC|nr:hypothetical protein TNIN_291711 [Trichonephila inaurata madagascariensis]
MEYREKISTWKFRANKKLNSLRISTPNETTHKITQSQSEITLDSSLKNALKNMFQEKKYGRKRLERCVKSLERSKRLSDYERVFENWLEEDIIEKVEPFNEDDNEHFLPHCPVFKDNFTTKMRPVFSMVQPGRGMVHHLTIALKNSKL